MRRRLKLCLRCIGIFLAVVFLFLIVAGLYFLNESRIERLLHKELSNVFSTRYHVPRIELSLWNRKVILRHALLFDKKNQVLLEIDKISVALEKLFLPKISSISIQGMRARFIYEDNAFNLDVFKPIQNTLVQDKKLKFQEIFKHCEQFLSKSFYFTLQNSKVSLHAPDFMKHDMSVDKIHFSMQRQQKNYELDLQYHCNILGPMEFQGTYHLDDGLYIQGKRSLYLYWDDIVRQILPLKDRVKVAGKTIIQDIQIQGFIEESEDIFLNCNIEQASSSIYIPEYSFFISQISGSVSVQKNQFHSAKLSAIWNDVKFYLMNGFLSLDGNFSLLCGFENCILKKEMLEVLQHFTETKLLSLWEKFHPQGELHGIGFLSFTPQTGWDWNTQISIANGFLEYERLQISKLNLTVQINDKSLYIQRGSWRLFNTTFTVNPGARILWDGFFIDDRIVIAFHRLHVTLDTFNILVEEIPEILEVGQFLLPQGSLNGKIILKGSLLKNLPVVQAKAYNLQLQLEEIPIPVHVVSGDLLFENKFIYFQNVEAYTVHSHSPIVSSGYILPLEPGNGVAFDIDFHVMDVPLEKNTYYAFTNTKDPTSWLLDIQDIWDLLSPLPDGKIEAQGRIFRRPGTPKKPKFDVSLKVKDASVEYEDFRYRVHHISGDVHITPEVVSLKNLKGRNSDQSQFCINGDIYLKSNLKPGIKITIDSKNVPLDDRLLRAIGEEFNEIWEQFSPKGIAHTTVIVEKPIGEGKVSWKADVDFQDVSLCFVEFPYQVSALHGKAQITPQKATFNNVCGMHGNNPICISGKWSPDFLDVKVSSTSLSLDKDLYSALPQDGKDIYNLFDLQGNVQFDLHVTKQGENPVYWKTTIQPNSLIGKYIDFPYQLQKLQGKFTLNSNHQASFDFLSKQSIGTVSINGTYDKEKLDVLIHAKNIALDKNLYHSLSVEYQEIWNSLQPSGNIDIVVDLSQKEEVKEQKIILLPKNCTAIYEKFPYELQEIQVLSGGGIFIYDQSILVEKIQARHGNAYISIQGKIDTLSTNEQVIHFTIQGKQVEVDSKFNTALAHIYPNLMEDIIPKGMIEKIKYDMILFSREKDPVTKFTLDLHKVDVQIIDNSFWEKFSGDVHLDGHIYNDNTRTKGSISNANITCKGLTTKELSCKVNLFTNYLLFDSIEGNFYDGNLTGKVVLDTTTFGAYKGHFIVRNSSLRNIAEACQTEEARAKGEDVGMSGLLHGEVSFQGNTFDIQTLTGNGRLNLNNGQIWEFPIFLALLDIFSLPANAKPAFRNGEINFSIQDKKFIINAMRFDSSLISLSGHGNIGFDGSLHCRFLTHFASTIMPKIPLVDTLIDSIRQHFLSIIITGTWSEPKVRLFM